MSNTGYTLRIGNGSHKYCPVNHPFIFKFTGGDTHFILGADTRSDGVITYSWYERKRGVLTREQHDLHMPIYGDKEFLTLDELVAALTANGLQEELNGILKLEV